MTVLVLGRSGQLAQALVAAAGKRGVAIRCAGRDEADLSKPGAAAALIVALRPKLVLNSAAYTAVDQAEVEPRLAFRINAEGAGEAAAAAETLGIPFVQISTDYVFRSGGPHNEDAPTEPVNIYGRSKLAGEQAVRSASARHLIVRTSWLYGATAGNFAANMLRLAATEQEVRVVDDQLGCPTSADDLADALIRLSVRLLEEEGASGRTLHLAGREEASWADFAEAIMTASQTLGGLTVPVQRVSTRDRPTPAERPSDSRLDCGLAERKLGLSLPGYSATLPNVVARLLAATAPA
jgi:dTDP-4-dehydrorhamnose reductase